jgi:hypothetical protein
MNGFKNGMSDENFLGGLRESVELDSPFAKALAQAGMLGANGIGDALNAAAAIIGKRSEGLQQLMDAPDKDAGAIVGAKEDLDKLLVAFQKQSTNILKVALEDFKIKELLEYFGNMAEGADNMPNIAQESLEVLKDIRDYLKGRFGAVGDFLKNIGTEKGTGKGTIFSTAEDSMFGMARRGGERLQEGGQGNSIIDILTPWDTLSEKLKKNAKEYNAGTYGFQNFGAGTPAILHGREMVIPEANASKIVSDLIGSVKTMEGTGNIASAPSTSGELRELIALYTRTLESNEKMSNSLNRLVTIGAMTEKNTKDTKINIANMGGSLV